MFRTELFLETVTKKDVTKSLSRYIVINIIEKFNMTINTLLGKIFVIAIFYPRPTCTFQIFFTKKITVRYF